MAAGTPALWLKHRSLARNMARDWFLPGSDRNDVEQEALIALWVAARTHDPEQASFTAWARVVIDRHLTGCLRTATRGKRQILTESARDPSLDLQGAGDVLRTVILRERLELMGRCVESFSEAERDALRRILDGTPLVDKADDNARYRARLKLRSAAGSDNE
jgi:RNA polymerase sigma factor (sigma-70 family)